MISREAIRLARLLLRLMPDESEATGLLALMLLQDSRRDARLDAAGRLMLLEDQDRSLWDRAEIDEGLELAGRASRMGAGQYTLQAAIAAEHASAPSAAQTAWPRIALLYGALAEVSRSPVVDLNRAVAWRWPTVPSAGSS